MGQSDSPGPRASIDLGAVRANAAVARRLAGSGRALIAVVKADAYGHGVLPVARELVAAGAEMLAVVTADEVSELREGGVGAPLLALGGPGSAAEASELVEREACIVLHHEQGARWVAEAAAASGRPAAVELEVDTGMHRMGVPEEAAVRFAERVNGDDALELCGVFSHFACADAADPAPTVDQCRRLRGVLQGMRERGVVPARVHIANSAGVLSPVALEALPEVTAVRPGLMLYGVRPAAHLGGELEPAMTLSAPVVQVLHVRSGESVGYGATFTAERDTRVATLGLGYADGLAWRAGGRGKAWLAGALRPLAGRVSMDSVGVEIGDAEVQIGDSAVLFGRGEGGGQAVEDAARDVGTLGYELLVRVGRRVRREYLNASV